LYGIKNLRPGELRPALFNNSFRIRATNDERLLSVIEESEYMGGRHGFSAARAGCQPTSGVPQVRNKPHALVNGGDSTPSEATGINYEPIWGTVTLIKRIA